MIIVGVVASASAQGGWVQLASDAYGFSCQNHAAGINTVYQIHQASPGTTLIRYRIVPSNPLALVWQSDSYAPWLAIGSAPTGVTVAYGECQASPVVIGHSVYNVLSEFPCEVLDKEERKIFFAGIKEWNVQIHTQLTTEI